MVIFSDTFHYISTTYQVQMTYELHIICTSKLSKALISSLLQLLFTSSPHDIFNNIILIYSSSHREHIVLPDTEVELCIVCPEPQDLCPTSGQGWIFTAKQNDSQIHRKVFIWIFFFKSTNISFSFYNATYSPLPLEFQPWERTMVGCSGSKLDSARDSSVGGKELVENLEKK